MAATHGLSRTKEYLAWQQMTYRCYQPTNTRYHKYGARGITVCPQWKDSFLTFLKDMGKAPSPQHSLGRKNNDGNYEPGNCRWETVSEQVSNKSNNHNITCNGLTLTIAEWSRRTGINRLTILMRIKRGWSPEQAVSTIQDARKFSRAKL